MKNTKEILTNLNACNEAIQWAGDKSIEEILKGVHRGDWVLWLASILKVDHRAFTLAKARCAKTVIHLMKDKRNIKAVKVAEQYGLGKATKEELKSAAAATSPIASYSDYSAYASASYYASYSAASYSAYAAATADSTADSTDAAAYAKSQQQTADICKEILGDLIIKKWKKL